MTFTETFPQSSPTQSADKPSQGRMLAVWTNMKTWLTGLIELLRAEQPENDPMACFTQRDWADLPPYHPDSLE